MRTSGIKHLLLVLCIIFSFNFTFCQNNNSVQIANDRDKTFVTVRVGNITIPKILLDTGFDFDGIIIYNPAYHDSIDLTAAFSVSLGGAGDKNAKNALMIDSTSFSVGEKSLQTKELLCCRVISIKDFPLTALLATRFLGIMQ